MYYYCAVATKHRITDNRQLALMHHANNVSYFSDFPTLPIIITRTQCVSGFIRINIMPTGTTKVR